MERNVRTYEHFCLTARALERLGDRWTLLVVRDLLTGPKRFTDLMERLGGITPKTLTQRLRDLEEGGVLGADRQPGRREVWYRLTPAGEELRPILDQLGAWGLRHAWRPPRPGEPMHIEHFLSAVLGADTGDPALWHFRFPGGDYSARNDGRHWTLSTGAPDGKPDLTVVATDDAFIMFAVGMAGELDGELSGDRAALDRFREQLAAFAATVDLS